MAAKTAHTSSTQDMPAKGASSRLAPRAPVSLAPIAEGDHETESEEAYKPRRIPTPILPSQEEVDEHNIMGHVQYRSWCPHCVAGRGVGQRHVPVEDEPGQLPKILSDYGYMNGQGKGEESRASEETGAADRDNLPILVVKDKKTKTIGASFVLEKGANGFAVKCFASFMQRMGHSRISNTRDGEHSIVALKTKAAQTAGVEMVPEESGWRLPEQWRDRVCGQGGQGNNQEHQE